MFRIEFYRGPHWASLGEIWSVGWSQFKCAQYTPSGGFWHLLLGKVSQHWDRLLERGKMREREREKALGPQQGLQCSWVFCKLLFHCISFLRRCLWFSLKSSNSVNFELERSALPKNWSEFHQELIEMVILRPGTEKREYGRKFWCNPYNFETFSDPHTHMLAHSGALWVFF